jgi:hypothetical protein
MMTCSEVEGRGFLVKSSLRAMAVLWLLLGHSLAQNSASGSHARIIPAIASAPQSEPNTVIEQPVRSPHSYYGFDSNEYPGDDKLAALRRVFTYTGYWLNTPPGARTNPWVGKRIIVEQAGFGFLVLFNGRLDAELRKAPDSSAIGRSDAALAADAAKREGFPSRTVIFLDVEEGGRMLPEQKAYIYAWVDAIVAAGYRAGVYCSGIPAREGHGVTIVTANDLRDNGAGREIVYWVANDGCPPSPGCGFTGAQMSPAYSGVDFAGVWQFAQSPPRPEMTRSCKSSYASDQNCYAEKLGPLARFALDMNTAAEADPSHGRSGSTE